MTVQEYQKPGGGRSISIVSNGKSDGNTFMDYMTMGLAATLPALMAEKAERAFVIGWGTGITAGELAALESMKRVDVAEISPAVMEAAPLFDFASLAATRNPKIHVVQSDAYRALMRADERYDLIISEPSNPWVTGVEMLFSREFLLAAKERLTRGGVYAQWFHQYETDADTVALVLRTYTEVFEHVAVWAAGYNDLLLLGLDDPSSAIDHFRLEERASRRDFAASLGRLGIASFPALLAHERIPVGVLHAAQLQGPIHTLYHPLLNDWAGRAFFRGDIGRIPFLGYGDLARIARENSMVHGYSLRFSGGLPDQARSQMIREAYRSLGPVAETLMAQWIAEKPDSKIFEETRAWMQAAVSGEGKKKPLGPLGFERVKRLAPLFEKRLEGDSNITPEISRQAQEDFIRFYHHAAPFEGDALLRIWGGCREGRQSFEWCREWARTKSLEGGAKNEDSLLESCLAKRFVGDQCREGLSAARRLLETGK